jgi:lipopolysaccharide transport system ATP-binding protein
MSADSLIKVQYVSKKFSKDLKRSLYYGLVDVFSGVIGRSGSGALRKDEFWAVRDVSFEVKRGECLGLIGHNGAGKSTLLKMLNGLITPDEGRIEMRGKVGALIELGAGFNPILTGRENIYNNAAVIGFSKKEVDAKQDSIIDFAELREFIDMPVQNYSSGMKVRLGFAVAAQMEPDILIIDEVLAVGDLGFRVKCINRINELMKKTAVIFVSHAMTQVSAICNRLILMDRGTIKFEGNDIGKGIEQYFLKFTGAEQQVVSNGMAELKLIRLQANTVTNKEEVAIINSGDTLNLFLQFRLNPEVHKIQIRVAVFNMEYRLLAEADSSQGNKVYSNTDSGVVDIHAALQGLTLRRGRYSIHVHVIDLDSKEKILRQSDVAEFVVKSDVSVGADFIIPATWS